MVIISPFYRWIRKPRGFLKRIFVLSLIVLDLYIVAVIPIVPFRVTCPGPGYRVFSGPISDGYTYVLRRALFRSDDSYTYWTNRAKRYDQLESDSEGPLIFETNVLIPLYRWFDLEKQHQHSMRAAIYTVQEEYALQYFIQKEMGSSAVDPEHLSNTLHGYRNGKLTCAALFFIAAEGRAPTVEEASSFGED